MGLYYDYIFREYNSLLVCFKMIYNTWPNPMHDIYRIMQIIGIWYLDTWYNEYHEL